MEKEFKRNKNNKNAGKKFNKSNSKYGKKNNSYDKDDKDFETKEKVAKKRNDVSWYSTDEHLKNLVSQISYNTIMGDGDYFRISSEAKPFEGITTDDYTYNMPGILRVNMTPTYGGGSQANDTITKAANAVYQYLRSQLKTTANYEPADIMMYLIAIDSIHLMITDVTRALGTCGLISQVSKYTPRALVTAMGYDYDDARAHWRDYGTRLNFIIMDLNSRYTPNLFRFQTRHRYVFGNVFCDTPEGVSQYYVPVATTYWEPIYDEDEPMYLQPHPFHGLRITTIGEALSAMEDMVSRIMDNNDFNKISSDLRNAYGESAMMLAPTLPEQFTLLPVWSEEFNLQLHNCVATGDIVYAGSDAEVGDNDHYYSKISQIIEDTAYGAYAYIDARYVTHLTSRYPFGSRSAKVVLDMPNAWSGDADSNLEATRLIPGTCTEMTYSPDGGETLLAFRRWNNCGSEIVNSFELFYYSTDGELTHSGTFTNAISDAKAIGILTKLETFSFHPTLYFFDDEAKRIEIFQNLRRYAVPSLTDIDDINRYALLGEFNLINLVNGGTLV